MDGNLGDQFLEFVRVMGGELVAFPGNFSNLGSG